VKPQIPALITIVPAVLLSAGCSTAPPQKTALMEAMEVQDITKRELQTLMYRYAEHYAGQIELASEEIYEQATDAEIRKNAILWNSHCAAEMMKNCFNNEPMVAMLSAWVFAAQVRDYYENGYGRDIFGPFQSIAIETSQGLEDDLYKIIQVVLPESQVEMLIPKLEEYIEEQPIRNQRFVSQFFSENVVKAMGAEVASGLSAAGSMNEQLVALTDRANILTAHLPRQVFWQTASVLWQSEQMIAQMRDSTLAAIRQEAAGSLDPVFTFLDQQRQYTTEDIAQERAAILEALADERTAVLSYLSQERLEVIQAIMDARGATMSEMDAMTLEALQQFMIETRGAVEASIDQIYLRTVQMLVLPMVFLVIFVIAVMIWTRNTVNRLLESRDERKSSQQ